MSFQLCLRCGRHEVAGSFCTFCLTAEYDLADHGHSHDAGAACPLGPYLDPLDTSKTHVRDYLAKPTAVWPVGLQIRAHQRAPGYTVQTDPPVPSWVRRRLAVSPPEHGRRRKPSNLPTPARGGHLALVPNQVVDGLRAPIVRLLVSKPQSKKGPSCRILMPD